MHMYVFNIDIHIYSQGHQGKKTGHQEQKSTGQYPQ